MRVLAMLMLGCAAMLPQLGLAGTDSAAGKAAYSSCAVCHGVGGEGNAALKAPGLTHLGPVYIVSQLGKFRTGLRGGPGAEPQAAQMAAMANTLASDEVVMEVAQYISTLPGNPKAATVDGDIALGADYFNQMCGACHGPAAEGNPALNSPALAGADDWYLLGQLTAFREGKRGMDAGDRSGRQMRAMAGVLPNDQAVNDVVAFIASVSSQ
jgi:cytochrome c553